MDTQKVLDTLADYQRGCTFQQFWDDMYPEVEDEGYVERKYLEMQSGSLYYSLDKEHVRRFCDAINRWSSKWDTAMLNA